jgi:hypothetical protein
MIDDIRHLEHRRNDLHLIADKLTAVFQSAFGWLF